MTSNIKTSLKIEDQVLHNLSSGPQLSPKNEKVGINDP